MSAEFDTYARSYETLHAASIKASGYDPSYFDQQKIRELHRIAGKQYQGAFNLLNFGCGIGKSEPYIRHYFEQCNIHSADTSGESLKRAAERNKELNITFHHITTLEQFNPGPLFDIIFVANVFHHIPADQHIPTLKKLKTLLSEQGRLFVFEHNPWNPLTRRAFNTCEFDKGCTMIASTLFKTMTRESGFSNIEVNYTLFFPKILKRLVPLEKYMTKLAAGAQYYVICS